MIGIPGANLDCNASNVCAPKASVAASLPLSLTADFGLLGDRGFSPFIGRHQCFCPQRFARPDPRQARHQSRRRHSRQSNEHPEPKASRMDSGSSVACGPATRNPTFCSACPASPSMTRPSTAAPSAAAGKLFRPFVQDDWRVTPNLTVNLGLAWNLTSPISEVDNRQADFDPANGKFLISGNTTFGPNDGNGSASNSIRTRSSPASAWPGSLGAATAPSSAPAMPSSMTRRGVRARRACGRTLLTTRNRIVFAFGGNCTFATAACASNPANTLRH